MNTEKDFYISYPSIYKYLVELKNNIWRILNESYKMSKITFFLQCIVAIGFIYCAVKVFPVILRHIPVLDNILNIPWPFSCFFGFLLLILTFFAGKISGVIKFSEIFRYSWGICTTLIILEILCVIAFFNKTIIKQFIYGVCQKMNLNKKQV